jgi:hypothetical protein
MTLNLSLQSDREKLEQLLSEDVDTFCATYYEQGHRNHLGASELGEECWRKLWYGFRWVKQEVFDGRMMRLFNVGHSAEPRFVTYLRGIGFEVKEFEPSILHYHPESGSYFRKPEFDPGDGLVEDVTGLPYHEAEAVKQGINPKQFRMSGVMGHYGGSLDGMCKAPIKYQLSEDIILSLSFKTNNTGSGYDKVSKEALSKSKPKHWAQECQYGYKTGIKYCIYMIENKNDSDITFKVIELDWNYGAQLEKKAASIITSKEPPPRISDNPAMFNCKFCHQVNICHNGATPEKNCRSCRNATPVENAEWHCAIASDNIPKDIIPIGCSQWLPI